MLAWNNLCRPKSKRQRKQLAQLSKSFSTKNKLRERYLRKITKLDKDLDALGERMASLEYKSGDKAREVRASKAH